MMAMSVAIYCDDNIKNYNDNYDDDDDNDDDQPDDNLSALSHEEPSIPPNHQSRSFQIFLQRPKRALVIVENCKLNLFKPNFLKTL